MALNRFILSSYAGCPTVSGTAGEWVTMLDAVLVNGFGGGTCTLSQAAGVATLTLAAHGFVDQQVVSISGATPSDYNGLKRVTYVSSSVVTFTIDSGVTSPATGTISCETASLGWTIAYTGTNKRVYRQGTGSLGYVLRVDDTGTPQAYTAIFRMAENATDIDTLVDPWPTAAQIPNVTSGFIYHFKAVAANSTTRAFIVGGDERSVFIASLYDGTFYRCSYFGEGSRISPSDPYFCLVAAHYSSSTITANARDGVSYNSGNSLTSTTLTTNAPTIYVARSADGATKSLSCGLQPMLYNATSQIMSDALLVRAIYGVTYGMSGAPCIWDGTHMRGFFRGVINPFKTMTHGVDVASADLGMTAGTTFYSIKVGGGTSDSGWLLLQKTGTLPT